MDKKIDLINPITNNREITSSKNIAYLAKEIINNDVTGIRYERRYANGNSEILTVWRNK
jgi:hypothetical protein